MDLNRTQRNSLYSLLKSASTIIYPLITYPYITRVLLVDNLGKLAMGDSVVSYISLLASMGISTYAIRECAKVREKKEDLSELASELFSINLCSTAAAYAVLVIVLWFVGSLREYRLLILIQSLSVAFTTIGADWINTAMEDQRYIALRTVAFQAVAIVLMLIFVHKPEDYYIYAVITVISAGGVSIANIAYRQKFCRVRFTRHMQWRRHMRPVLYMLSLLVAQTVYTNSDLTMIDLMRGDYETGIYSVAVKVYNLVNTIVSSVTMVVVPGLTVAFRKNDYDEVNRILRYAIGFIVMLGIPSLIGIDLMADDIVAVISGDAYDGAANALRILSIALAASFVGGFWGNMTFLPAGREDLCFKISICSAVINLILNLLLISRYGYLAAAATTAVAEIVAMCMSFYSRDGKIHLVRIGDVLLTPIVACVPVVLVILITQHCIGNLYARVLIAVVLSAIVYFGTLFLTGYEGVDHIRRRGV